MAAPRQDAEPEAQELELELELQAVIGFNGHIHAGLTCHPDREHLIYPLGCTVITENLNNSQSFLHGHTNNVSCVAVSPSGRYIASGQVTFMGFKADIILWDYEKKELLARLSLHKGKVEKLAFSPNDLYLVSLGGQDDGNGTIRVWELDLPNRKIRSTECQTGQLKRVITCIIMADDDSYFYVGTTSGDILKLNTKSKLMSDYGPMKDKFSQGVTALLLLKTGELLVGTGGGIIALFKGSNYRSIRKIQVQGGVTSLTLRGQGHQFFAGTEESQIYRINFAEFKEKCIATCHNEAINDIIFPLYSRQGSLGLTMLFTGGFQVRVWEIGQNTRKLGGVLKEHISAVSCIKIKKNNLECITASLDGTCIIWDLVRLIRNQMILANTLFQCVCYHPEEFQIITSGTDRNIGWWEVFDGSVIRELEGSVKGSINGMDITSDGTHFVTGGDDHLVKVWDYDTGEVTHVGVGHSGSIRRLKICPGNKYIVSVSADGAILRWKYPHSH
ncbi:PREDICTED: cilia- and flagella-associated protein 52-like [Crocodylus porosus]|uniref:cilia- and flagella-associated protein 52-like n=1 Tax=Crocodylus porosus TaxID=8502 RepID=UPI000940625A|nr:PREDICTED: cilia- and flagella-associated protein 52-like [Crocodylus porosus]